MNDRYLKRPNETKFEWGLRLIKIKKEENPSDLDWQDIIDNCLDANIHRDSLRKAQDTPYGGYAVLKYFEQKGYPKTNIESIKQQIGELEVVKQQMKNEKNQLNKIKREFIKSISIAEDLKEYFKDNCNIVIPDYCKSPINLVSKYEMIVCISDWHIGYVIDNCKGNSYNWQIANERIDKLIAEVYKYIELYGIKKIYVFGLGDWIEHVSMRANQNQFCEFTQAEQINKAIELIYRFLVALCKYCDVEYDSVYGNHDRMNGDKKANLDGDNADTIIARQIDTYRRLSGNRRLIVNEHRHTDKEVVKEIQGLKCMLTHGEYRLKDAKRIIKDEISVNNEFYDLFFKGHLHNFSCISENNGRYIISTGCLSGFNDYSVTFGCSTVASQTIVIVGDGKIEMIKDVQLQ